MEENKSKYPKIGLALSGAAARSVFYIGFLEKMQEAGIPIGYIVAQSGAAVVSASFACGTLKELKQDLMQSDTSELRKMLMVRSKQGSGFYTLDTLEDYARDRWYKGKTFEELRPRLCFMGADIIQGQVVPLAMGDVAKAVRISCTVPGLFEPVPWGNRLLVDGGLLSYMPGDIARQGGVDVVIGVSVRASMHIFQRHQMVIKDIYNRMKRVVYSRPRSLLLGAVAKVVDTQSFSDYVEDFEVFAAGAGGGNPGMFSVVGRSIDLAIKASRNTQANMRSTFGCDILIQQGVGRWGDGFKLDKMSKLYQDGLVAGDIYIPQIKKYLENYGEVPYAPLRLVAD